MLQTRFRLAWVVLAVLVVGGFTGCPPAEPVASGPLPSSTLFPVVVGGRTVSMEIVAGPEEMARGLMHRPSLPPEQGMLFVYGQPRRLRFWMKNTLIPLDIGFFDAAGVLREVYPMYPGDTAGVQSRSDRLQYALEMNLGWYARAGLAPGAKLDLAAVRDALRRRGFDPARLPTLPQ